MVSHKDAVYNLSRAALATAAFCEGNYALLGVATKDVLHKKYRLPLIEGRRRRLLSWRRTWVRRPFTSRAPGRPSWPLYTRTTSSFSPAQRQRWLRTARCTIFTVHRLLADNVGAVGELIQEQGKYTNGLDRTKIRRLLGQGPGPHLQRGRVSSVNTRNAGNDVVVVVSAQGDTTDDLIAKAAGDHLRPVPPRDGYCWPQAEEISISLLTMALQELGVSAISLTGWQAGFQYRPRLLKARIKRLDTERVESELARNRCGRRGRLPGPEPLRRHHDAGPRRQRYLRRGAGRCAARGPLPDLHRRRGRLHRRPAQDPQGNQAQGRSRLTRCSSWRPWARRC